jgi:hypothetical protein
MIYDRKIDHLMNEAKNVLVIVQGGKLKTCKPRSVGARKTTEDKPWLPEISIEQIANSVEIAKLDEEAKLNVEDAEYLREVLQKVATHNPGLEIDEPIISQRNTSKNLDIELPQLGIELEWKDQMANALKSPKLTMFSNTNAIKKNPLLDEALEFNIEVPKEEPLELEPTENEQVPHKKKSKVQPKKPEPLNMQIEIEDKSDIEKYIGLPQPKSKLLSKFTCDNSFKIFKSKTMLRACFHRIIDEALDLEMLRPLLTQSQVVEYFLLLIDCKIEFREPKLRKSL